MDGPFKPRDGDYEEKVRQSFGRQAVMELVDATIHNVEPGHVELEFPYRADLTQQHGFVHAGIVSTVLDSACGYAAFSLMPKDAAVLTVEFKVNLLSPATGDRFRAVGKVIKPGKIITVTNGEMFACTGNDRKLIASMTGTMMSVYDRKGIDK